MILGCDAAGVDEDGNEVVVHAVISETVLDAATAPRAAPVHAHRALPGHLRRPGRRPCWNVLPKPESLSFEEAACLPTAWLTAYRMLFTRAGAAR